MTSHRILESAALTLGLVIAASGCAYDMEEAPELDSPDELEPQGVFANHLTDNALTRNALITNRAASAAMVTVPLATASYSDTTGHPDLKYQLHHAPTREVMGYLVSCALDSTMSVSYTDSFTGQTHAWPGEIGLCPAWATGPASTTCLELVSACLVARVNAFGKRVTLSMRGEVPGAPPGTTPGPVLYPAPVVRTGTLTEDNDAIASFEACSTATGGVARNCGWVANHVGTCDPGAIVHIGAGAKPPSKCSDPNFPVLGSSAGNTVLRVCEGILGCNSTSTNFIAHNGTSCSTNKPALSFTCPPSGVYSVMSGSQSSEGSGVATPAAHWSGAAHYPAPEREVFRWPEGAFYGTLWGAGALHPNIALGMNKVNVDGTFTSAPPVVGSVFRQAFACTGPFWTNEKAYMEDRVCAGSDENCAAIPVGACNTSNDNTPSCPATHRCGVLDGPMVPNDGDFQECSGATKTWSNPISVYLQDPSDIVEDADHSATLGSPDAPGVPLCP